MSGEERRGLLLCPDFGASEPFELFGGDVVLHVRHTSPKKMREIRKSIGLPAWRPDGEKLSDDQTERLQVAVLDWTLASWEGVVDPDGNPVPCSAEAKVALLNDNELVATNLPRFATLVGLMRGRAQGVRLGNSDGSSTGSPSTRDTSATETARGADANATS